MLNNLAPQDARCIEIAGAVAMLLIAIDLVLIGHVTSSMSALHPPQFWALALGSLAVLQLTSLLCYPVMEILRICLALLNGSWWVWLALTGMFNAPALSNWASLLLGVGNLYAFSVGFLLEKSAWKS